MTISLDKVGRVVALERQEVANTNIDIREGGWQVTSSVRNKPAAVACVTAISCYISPFERSQDTLQLPLYLLIYNRTLSLIRLQTVGTHLERFVL